MIIGVDARVLTQKEIRGISRYLLEVLKAWPNKSDKFVLFYESGKIYNEVFSFQNEVTTMRVPEPRGTRFKIWHWLAMPRALRRVHLDVLWCPANLPIPFTQHAQVVTIHDTILQESFISHSFFDHIFYKTLVPYFTRRYTSRVITVSKFSKRRISDIFGIPHDFINVIYNGLNFESISYQPKENTRRMLLKRGIKNNPFIFALGAISPWKNTDRLLEAFRLVTMEEPNIYLVIAGMQKEALERYESCVNRLGIIDKVYLLEFVPQHLKNALYHACELFVYPSLFEGFGLPVLEAMAAGCAVVASNSASIPEVANDAAILVDARCSKSLSQGILRLLRNPELKKRLIQQGYKNVTRFSWEKSSKKHRELFLEMGKK